MDLKKYKVCPVCGEHNAPNLLECRKCETDLTGVKVVDSTTEQKEQEHKETAEKTSNLQVSSGSGSPALVRICSECGAQNPPQARKCQTCGEDISDIIPTPVQSETPSFSYTLKAVDDDYEVIIDRPVVVIGREAELKEYLGSKTYVSRQHAKLTAVAGKVLIENLSKTNHTFINNNEIKGDEPVDLSDGDEIGLGGIEIHGQRQEQAAYFLFHTKK